MDRERLGLAASDDLLAGLDDLVPGLERRLDAELVQQVLAVGEDDGVELVAETVDLTAPAPRVAGGRLVDVVDLGADALGQRDERHALALEELGEAGDLDLRDVRGALAADQRREQLVVHLSERELAEVDRDVRILVLEDRKF